MAGENLEELSSEKAGKLLKEKKSDLNVRNNFELLEKAANEAQNSLLISKNPEIKLQKMCSGIVFIAPEIFQNPKSEKHLQQKKEIELYIDSFDNICQQINDHINKAKNALINLQNPSIELFNEITNILKEYTKTVKDLCTPLMNERNGLNSELTLSENEKVEFEKEKTKILDIIDQFMEEAKDLNNNYLNQFKVVKDDVNKIYKSIDIIPDPINTLREKVEYYKSKFEETLDEINDESVDIHKELLKIKDLFRIIKQEKQQIVKNVERSMTDLNIEYDCKKNYVDPLKKEIELKIESLNSKSVQIKNDIQSLRNKYKQKDVKLINSELKPIKTKGVNEKICNFYPQFKNEASEIAKSVGVAEIENNIIKQTSIDILYIMDLTGSMESYIDNTKKELINVMKKIIESFNGIDINLGFIGYKDLEEHSKNDYIDINFTKNHEEIKKKIEEVGIGGGGDIAEDIAFAFDRALNKKWESNAKFAILAGDAPCHGLKYHGHEDYDDYPDGIPGRKDIEESINELCNKNVCLLCIKLSERTDMMFQIFKDIYTNNNKKSLFFTDEIENADNLNKMILEKCKEVYEKNRNIK